MRGGITRRLAVASALLMLLVGAGFVVLLLSVQDLRSSERLASHSQAVLTAANQLERLMVDLDASQRGFFITEQERFLQPWDEARAALPGRVHDLEQLVADSPEQLRRVRQIGQLADSYVSDYSVPLINAARTDPAVARSVAATDQGKARVDAIRDRLDDLIGAETRLSAAEETHSDNAAYRAVVAAAIGLVGSILLILAFAVYLNRAVIRPVLGMAQMADRLAGGDLGARVPESGVGEIHTLEHALNSMAGSLAEAQAELAASRARIVRSADETRRRIERDLHDGIQQRLVSLALDLRGVQAGAPAGQAELDTKLDEIAEGLASTLDELREISRGIHPAILSEGGIGPALKMLARRSAIPVEVDLRVDSRLPPPVEVAAYYVVSEALTNAVKHADASVAYVDAYPQDGRLHLSVRDDGAGGADLTKGSGLLGLADRIQALGGTITIDSPRGKGTALQVDLPIAHS